MNAEALRQAITAWNTPTERARYFQLYHTASVWHNLPPDLPPTLAGARIFYDRLWAALPTACLVLDELIARGDRLGCRYTLYASPARATPGQTGLTVLRMVNQQCLERWTRLEADAFELRLREGG